MELGLDGKVALITGGSDGIGYASAWELANEGATVVICARGQEALDEAVNKISSETGGVISAIACDVTDVNQIETTFQKLINDHGRVDILVNNAGFGLFKPLIELTLEELESVYRTNVFGAFLMSREAAHHFIEQGSGELINIASTSSLKGSATRTAYGSSKFALRGMTECWRDELRRHNVRVMLVNPSEVMTEFATKAGAPRDQSDKKLRPQEIADAIIGALKVDSRGFVPEFSVFATNPF